MTSVVEEQPLDNEKAEAQPVNDDVETKTPKGQEIQIENNEKEEEVKPCANEPIEETPTEFKEEVKEKTRVQKLFECPKCKKMLTKKTLNYYHECTKDDVPKAKRRPKKIVVKDITEDARPTFQSDEPENVPITRQTNQIIEQGQKFLTGLSDEKSFEMPVAPIQKSYEEFRKERLQQRMQERVVKIQQLFASAI